MLYLKSLSVSRFKSFKHAELLFSRGFTCIVGPNGSGKSNICDALLFGMGENSLRRLRSSNLNGLISSSAKKRGELARTMVRVKLEGDESIEIVRVARADGKSAFRLNGKIIPKKEVVEVLKKHKMDVNETNTITQGEIDKMRDLNPKERRELIDVASGIKEFDDKKNEAMKEMEKVSINLNEAQSILNERYGFLKDLEREKEVAEKYLAATARMKSLKYSIICSRLSEVEKSFGEYSRRMALLDADKQKIVQRLDAISGHLMSLSKSREELSKEFQGSSSKADEIKRSMEKIGTDAAVLGAEIESIGRNIKEWDSEQEADEMRLIEVKKKTDEGKAAVSRLEKRIMELEPEVAKRSAKFGDMSALEKMISDSAERVQSMQDMLNDVLLRISKEQLSVSNLENIMAEKGKAKNDEERKLSSSRSRLKTVSEESLALAEKMKNMASDIEDAEAYFNKCMKQKKDTDSSILELKSQRALAYSRESGMSGRIKSAFSEKDGFYGTVSELCTFKPEHAQALEAAAGSRMECVVVDSISTASKIIDYLRSNRIGRANFIPLKEIRYENTKNEAGLVSAISLAEFDKKFLPAMEYVFGGTYIVDRIDDAKVHGLGKRRYVTLSGDIAEKSGAVSGGFSKKTLPLRTIDASIKKLEEDSLMLNSALDSGDAKLRNIRKEQALLSLSTDSNGKELKALGIDIAEREKSVRKLAEEIDEYGKRSSEARVAIKNLASEAEALKDGIEREKESAKFARAKGGDGRGKDKEELQMLESMKKELESIKISKAAYEKEMQMNYDTIKSIDAGMSARNDKKEKAKREMKDKKVRMDALLASRSELEEKISMSSRANKDTYEKVQKIAAEMGDMEREKGSLESQLANIERQINDIKVQKAQAEVRINDLKAESASYGGESLDIINESLQSMEEESLVLASRIKEFGNVNMMAPEMYDVKRKDVEEAKSKVEQLSNEKEAVLKMISEIESKKFKVFSDTFEAVSKNFNKFYGYISSDSAIFELTDPKDPFNSGLNIRIDTGKMKKHMDSMSGGEKSLIMIVFIFAIHSYHTSSLYIFDEIDTALDKENSKKLSQLIKNLSKDSQFIVVSHNDSLVADADVAIGVAKANDESRAIGLEIGSIMASKGAL